MLSPGASQPLIIFLSMCSYHQTGCVGLAQLILCQHHSNHYVNIISKSNPLSLKIKTSFLRPLFFLLDSRYHSVNRKVHASKNKSFLFCFGPPLYNVWLCSCTVLWKTNSAVQLGSSRQQLGNFNPIFFPFGTSQIYLVIKKGKAPNHMRRTWKWRLKLCQNPTCRLRNTTGQEMNPQ